MLADGDYRALQEQSHMLAELEKHPGWPVLVDYLQAVVGAPLRKKLLNGLCGSYEDYRSVAAELAGIERAINAPHVVRTMLDGEMGQRVEHDEPLT